MCLAAFRAKVWKIVDYNEMKTVQYFDELFFMESTTKRSKFFTYNFKNLPIIDKCR